MDLSRLTLPQRISLGAAAIVAISAFLPWASVFGLSVSGLNGDGVITLVLALIGGGLLLVTSGAIGAEAKMQGKASEIALVVISALVALIGIIDLNGFAAIGLYLTWLAGMVWVGCAIWQLVSKPSNATV